jgi:formamidopyrimidine-DNA glycosylase
MPELPEAETIARGLRAAIAGRRVQRVRIHRPEVVEPMTTASFRRALSGRRVESVGRRAKWITATLDDGRHWVTQLRMTGRFSWRLSSRVRPEPHLSVSFVLAGLHDTGVLRFYDVRRFGRMQVLDPDEWGKLDERLGIEPLSDAFTAATLARLTAGSRAPVRNVLLDQERVAGIGNIYASEACFAAGIDPRRPAASLDGREVRKLHSAIRRVLALAVQRRGTSLSDYRDILGGEGEFQNELDVYGRAGERCRHCGTEIARVIIAGRSAFLCPRCQR